MGPSARWNELDPAVNPSTLQTNQLPWVRYPVSLSLGSVSGIAVMRGPLRGPPGSQASGRSYPARIDEPQGGRGGGLVLGIQARPESRAEPVAGFGARLRGALVEKLKSKVEKCTTQVKIDQHYL